MNCKKNKINIKKIRGIYSFLWQLILFIIIGIVVVRIPFKSIFNSFNTPIGSINLNMDEQNLSLLNIIVFICCEWRYYDFITKNNSDKIIFEKGDYYRDFPYILYWLGSYFFKYKYCNLVNVPIYLQFKLVLNNVFPIFLTGKSTNENDNSKNYREDLSEPIITKNNEELSNSSKAVNLILIDTYIIPEKLLPSNIFSEFTIYIYRSATINGVRVYNERFVEAIQQEVANLNPHIDTINVYATTNPKHNKQIVDKCFRLGERTNISCINVGIQEKGTWTFNDLKKIK